MKTIGVTMMILAVGLVCTSRTVTAQPLVYCSEGDPEGFDPSLYTAGTTMDASSRQLYNRLVQFARGGSEIVPGLAYSWDVSDDGLEYTFHLRRGVKYHTIPGFVPSRDFTAADVVFSFQRQLDEGHPYHDPAVYSDRYEYFRSMAMPAILRDVVALDDYTVKFLLNQPDAPMLANLAMDWASIVSAEYAERMLAEGTPEKLNRTPVGTGPFILTRYVPNQVIRYRAHDDYWGGKAPLDNLIFAITPDASARYQRLRAGECHVMALPNPSDLPAMRSDPAIAVLNQAGLNTGYLAYNTLMPPFDDPRVRRALNMAIDKQAILAAVFRGAGIVAKNPIPPGLWSFNESTVDDPYDPERAVALLKEAGVSPANLKTKIRAMPVQRPYNPNARLMAELIQAHWKAIGVEASIVVYDWSRYLELSAALDRDGAVLLGWTSDNSDPDNFLGLLLSCAGVGGANRAQWCNEGYDRLIQEAKQLTDQSERAGRYEEAQLIFKEQAPWATIAHGFVYEGIRTEVRGYRPDPFGGHYFYGVSLDR